MNRLQGTYGLLQLCQSSHRRGQCGGVQHARGRARQGWSVDGNCCKLLSTFKFQQSIELGNPNQSVWQIPWVWPRFCPTFVLFTLGPAHAAGMNAIGLPAMHFRTPSYFFWSGLELSANASYVCESPQVRTTLGLSTYHQEYSTECLGPLGHVMAVLINILRKIATGKSKSSVTQTY